MKKLTALCIAVLLACLLFLTACSESVSIAKIEKTGSEGLVDTYTITLTNGESTTFTVTNGKDGIDAKSAELDANAPTADDYFRFKLINDTYEISARYIDLPPKVIIPSEHDGKKVTSIAANGFYGRGSVDEIIIPDSIEHIGEFSFANCNGLVSITIPNSVTYIGQRAFDMCSHLTSAIIPDSVEEIGGEIFHGCDCLSTLTIPFVGQRADDESTCSYFSYLFKGDEFPSEYSDAPYSLKSVTITGGTSIGPLAFFGCRFLESVTIPTTVTSIGYDAFYGCDGLNSVINYAGTMEQWGEISKDGRWWNGNATVHCTDGELTHQ